jgi:hypothetical protein
MTGAIQGIISAGGAAKAAVQRAHAKTEDAGVDGDAELGIVKGRGSHLENGLAQDDLAIGDGKFD